jgi:hypothetical protein
MLIGAAPTYATSAGPRVLATRNAPVRSDLPALSVYTDTEIVSETSVSSSPRELARTLTLVVEGWVSASDTNGESLDNALDAVALEIETALDQDLNLLGTAFTSVLTSTEFGVKVDGNRPMGCVHLEFAVVYHSDLRVSAPTDAFSSVDVHYNLGGQATADQAHDIS